MSHFSRLFCEWFLLTRHEAKLNYVIDFGITCVFKDWETTGNVQTGQWYLF